MKKIGQNIFVSFLIAGTLLGSTPVYVFADDVVADRTSDNVEDSRGGDVRSENPNEDISGGGAGDPVASSDVVEIKSEYTPNEVSGYVQSRGGGGKRSIKSRVSTAISNVLRRNEDRPVVEVAPVLALPSTAFIPSEGAILSTVQINDLTVNGPVLADGDNYARSIANIGDFNNDGIIDLASGAYNDDTGGEDRGAVYLHFMNADGSVKSTKKIDDSTPNGPTLQDRDHYGSAIAPLGDMDGNGVIDLLVGAYYDDVEGYEKGAVYIHFMNADGSVKSTKKIDDSTPNGPTLSEIDHYGAAVANLGDLDLDGVVDIAVTAHYDDTAGENRGAIYIHFLNSDATIKSTKKITDNTANGPVLADNDYFGTGVANIGDFNGDGVIDIAAGAYAANAGGENRGGIFVMLMKTNGSIISTFEINSLTQNGPVLEDFDYYGRSVASLGDMDGDGVLDIAVGANYDDDGGADQGAVYLHFMNADGSVKKTKKISDLTPNGPELESNGRYGMSLASLGDLNGDNIIDLAVGERSSNVAGANKGALHIHFFGPVGGSGGPESAPNAYVYSTVQINKNTPNGPVLSDGDHYGSGVAGIGDVNNDGVLDIAVGAWRTDANSGAAYVHLLRADGSVKSTVRTTGAQLTVEDFYGRSVAGMGDVDGDGTEDIVVGAHGDDNGNGAVYLHFLNTDGSVKSTKNIGNGTPNGPVLVGEERYAGSLANIGDINGDGINDIAVGAHYDDTAGLRRGAVYIHTLSASGDIIQTYKLSDNTPNGANLADDDQYGSAVANLGDINGDGISDIAVGAYYRDVGGEDRGAIFIHYMGPNATILSTIEINDTTPNGPILADVDHYGRSITSLGDFDGDGISDIAVGANYDDAGDADRGALHIHYMNADGSIKTTEEINSTTPNGPVLLGTDGRYTVGVANIGDINGDGKIDLLVGEHRNDTGGENMGAIHIHFFGPNAPVGGAGFSVSKTSVTMAENGGIDTFDVVLTHAPAGNVVFDVTSSSPGDVFATPTTLIFTPANWNIPQTVTLTAVNDGIDQDETVIITISVNDALSDDAFDNLADKTIVITLTDDESGSSGGNGGGGGGGGGTKFSCHDPNATNYNPKYKSKPSLCQYGEVLGAAILSCEVTPYLTQPIKLGAPNNTSDVILLEQYLNTYEGKNLPVDGFYSQADFDAVIQWQEKYAQDILAPWGITKGTGYVFMTSLQKIKQTHTASCLSAMQETQILSCSQPLLYPTKPITLGGQNDAVQVKLLEKYLNTYESTSLPVDGVYSQDDVDAVIKWQEKYAQEILAPAGLSKGTGNIAQPSLEKIKKAHEQQCSLFVINPEF